MCPHVVLGHTAGRSDGQNNWKVAAVELQARVLSRVMLQLASAAEAANACSAGIEQIRNQRGKLINVHVFQ